MPDAKPSRPHIHPVSAPPAPNAGAGGRQVLVPGAERGRIVSETGTGARVVEVDLPSPEAAIFLVDEPGQGSRVVVLADPRVDPERLARTVAAAEMLEREQGHEVPPIPLQRTSSDAPARFPWSPRLPSVAMLAGFAGVSDLALTACTIFS